MPYETDEDLPSRVRNNLPQHAQHIYREAFNHAWNEYKDPGKRENPEEDREAVAHKVAWSAVKKEYHKEGGDWVADDDTKKKNRHH